MLLNIKTVRKEYVELELKSSLINMIGAEWRP